MISHFPPLPTGAIHSKRTHVPMLLAVVLTVLHFLFIMLYYEPAISSADGYGYMAQARRIAENGHTFIARESPAQFIGPHFNGAGDGIYHSQYPPGYPLMLALFRAVGGPKAMYILNPALASLSLLLLFHVGSAFAGQWAALLASALFAANPVANRHALMGDAHTSALFVLLLAMFAVLKWDETKSWGWLFAGGLLVGIIPSIRYAEAVMAPAFCAFIFFKGRIDRRTFANLGVWIAGFVLPVFALMIRNRMAFGSLFSTGYDNGHMGISFGLRYFISYAPQYLEMLGGNVGIMFGIGTAGIVFMLARPGTRRSGIFLGLLIVPVTLLYMAYFWHPDSMSARFLLPTFPVYLIGGAWLIRSLTGHSRGGGIAVGIAVLMLTLAWGVPESVTGMSGERRMNHALALIASCVDEHAGSDDIVAVGMMTGQHLDSIGSWKTAALPAGAGRRGRIPFMMPFTGGERHTASPNTGGFPDGSERLSGADWRNAIASWAGDESTVYFVCSEDEFDSLLDVFDADELAIVGEIDLSSEYYGDRNERSAAQDMNPFPGKDGNGMRRAMMRGTGGPMGNLADFYYLIRWVR